MAEPETEIKEWIHLRLLLSPRVGKGSEVHFFKVGIGLILDQIVIGHEGHLIIGLVAGADAALILRPHDVGVVGVLLPQPPGHVPVFAVARHVIRDIEV